MKKFFWTFNKIVKIILSDKSFIFWIIIFPIVLMTLYFVSFKGISNNEIQDINIGYNESTSAKKITELVGFIKGKKMSLEKGKENLLSGKIVSYIKDDDTILNSEKGISQTIVKNSMDKVQKFKYLAINGKNINKADFNTKYIKSVNQFSNVFNIIYFSLIAMVSLQSYYGALDITRLVFPNKSVQGRRIGVSPINKDMYLVISIIAALILNIIANSILLLYIKFVLNMELIKSVPKTFLLIISGNIFGIGLGLLIGSTLNFKDSVKNSIGAIGILFLSVLSGMMNSDVKFIIDKNLPIINKLNPVSIITDNLNRINMLGIENNYIFDSVKIILIGIIFIIITSVSMRRQRYDSI